MDVILDNIVFIAIAAGIGFVVFRFFKFGNLAGSLLGSAVVRTHGELELTPTRGTSQSIKIHTLENGNIALEETTKAFLSASTRVTSMSRDQANSLAHALAEAARDPSDA